MILRKPYAFLIKHFKKIHIVLFAFAVYVLYKTISLQGFVNEYIAVGFYNPYVDSIQNYTNFLVYFSIFIIVAVAIILIYLLHFKKKPHLLYYFLIGTYLLTAVSFMVASNYFVHLGVELIDLQKIRIVTDFLLIASIPQYVMLIVLLIRFLGLDMKKFGFRHDEEYIEVANEDNEEFEFDVEIDKDQIRRVFKNKTRNLWYFYKEHQIYINIVVSCFLVVLVGFLSYYFLVLKRAYGEGQTFEANSYLIKINQSYLTDKDTAGHIVSSEGKKYIILDVSVKNNGARRTMDVEKFMLISPKTYYVPTVRYDEKFKDLGKPYAKKEFAHGSVHNFLLIYEVDEGLTYQDFALYYQEVVGPTKATLRKVKIKPNDISVINQEKVSLMQEEMMIQDKGVTVKSYEIGTTFPYSYESCSSNNCTIKVSNVSAPNSQTILNIRFTSLDYTKKDFVDFVKSNGSVRYIKTDGSTVDRDVKLLLSSGSYIGEQLYLLVDPEIVSAKEIQLVLTYRNQKYVFKLI